jgi:hypothetical protein
MAASWPAIRQLINTGNPPAATTDTAAPANPAAPGVPAVDPKKEPTMDAADLERRIQETSTLRGEAEKILGPDYKVAGKSNREIRLDVIKACAPTFTLDAKAADESVAAAYAMSLNVYAEREAHKAQNANSLAELMAGSRSPTTDAADKPKRIGDAAYDAWKLPAAK